MATAAASKVASRISARLHSSIIKPNGKSLCPQLSRLIKSCSGTARPSSRFARLPVELSCVVGSIVPLHSAIASARMISSLSRGLDSWALVPQGISMPL